METGPLIPLFGRQLLGEVPFQGRRVAEGLGRLA